MNNYDTPLKPRLQALIDTLAIIHGSPGIALHRVAKELDLSLSYIEQLAHALRDADLAEGQRGPGGGYRTKDADVLKKVTLGHAYEITYGEKPDNQTTRTLGKVLLSELV